MRTLKKKLFGRYFRKTLSLSSFEYYPGENGIILLRQYSPYRMWDGVREKNSPNGRKAEKFPNISSDTHLHLDRVITFGLINRTYQPHLPQCPTPYSHFYCLINQIKIIKVTTTELSGIFQGGKKLNNFQRVGKCT